MRWVCLRGGSHKCCIIIQLNHVLDMMTFCGGFLLWCLLLCRISNYLIKKATICAVMIAKSILNGENVLRMPFYNSPFALFLSSYQNDI